MNAILGYSQLMLRDPALTPAQRRAVGTIQTAGAHLLGMINEALDLSKIESGRMELTVTAFDLTAMLHGVAAMFEDRAAQKGLRLVLDIPAERLLLRGDEGKLRQVLINLLGNALKFTDSGGISLTVTAQRREDGESLFEFSVSDTGPGIPPEDQERIFEPFHQAEVGMARGGTGLGLAIARDFVALMAGAAGSALAVTSKPGQGAHFSFTLPLEIVARDPDPPLSARQASSLDSADAAWDPIAPAGDLLGRMLAAAETCSTTELKRLVAELPRETPGQRRFRRALEGRIGEFDYRGIRQLIEAVGSQSRVER